jgi:hypothetical protein
MKLWIVELGIVASLSCGGATSPADAGEADGKPMTGTGGTTGAGGTTGTGGMMATDAAMAIDHAMDAGAGVDAAMHPANVPLRMDGTQGAVCPEAPCHSGLTCASPSVPGQGFCTALCSGDADCAALADAAYTCITGICEVSCTGTSDTDSCPSGMICAAFAGVSGGGGVHPAAYHCQYPPHTAHQWEHCDMSSNACDKGLFCTPLVWGKSLCTTQCAKGDACPSAPPGGSIASACVPFLSSDDYSCDLDCSAKPDGCPAGMTCQMTTGTTPVIGRCR